MTQFSGHARRTAGAGLIAVAAACASASSAQAAQTATVNYRCKFPLIGTQPLKLDISLDIPDQVELGEPTPPFAISAKAAVSGTTSQALGLVEFLATLGGVTDAQKPGKGTAARARVLLADGTGINVRVPIDVEPYTVVPPIADPLVLNASGSTPSLTLDVPGTARVTLTELILNLYGHDFDGKPVDGLTTPPTDIERRPYADIDGDPDTFNVPCLLAPTTQSPQLAEFQVGHSDPCEIFDNCPPPQTPADVRVGTVSPEGRTTISWSPVPFPGNNPAVEAVEYVVQVDGELVGVTDAASLDIEVDPSTSHTGSVTARYTPSDPDDSAPAPFTVPAALECVPGTPFGLEPVAGSVTPTQFRLKWQAPELTGNGTTCVDHYEIRVDGRVIRVAGSEVEAAVTGLQPGKTYTVELIAFDPQGDASRAATATVTTLSPPPADVAYSLAGSATLKTLTKGSLALKGQADLTFGPPASARTVDGTLDLGQTSGRLVALGFLPVTAKVGFVSSGAATGVVGGFTGGLSLSQKVRIKVLEAKLFGAIPLIGGNTCQTKQLTTLSLSSPGVFSTADGGSLAGTFSISDLNGCGALNGLVSPLTAGGGNTINVTLTPKATS